MQHDHLSIQCDQTVRRISVMDQGPILFFQKCATLSDMKTSSKLLRFLAVGAVACMLLPITLPAARDGDAQLVVKRAANFGSNLDLTVIVDGQKVGRVIFGHE